MTLTIRRAKQFAEFSYYNPSSSMLDFKPAVIFGVYWNESQQYPVVITEVEEKGSVIEITEIHYKWGWEGEVENPFRSTNYLDKHNPSIDIAKTKEDIRNLHPILTQPEWEFLYVPDRLPSITMPRSRWISEYNPVVDTKGNLIPFKRQMESHIDGDHLWELHPNGVITNYSYTLNLDYTILITAKPWFEGELFKID